MKTSHKLLLLATTFVVVLIAIRAQAPKDGLFSALQLSHKK